MVRILTLAATMIAVSTIAAAAPVVSQDVPVPGGIAALARAIGIGPPDRARLVAELARIIYSEPKANRPRPNSTFSRLLAHFASVGQTSSAADIAIATDVVPMPLSAEMWSQAVFHRPVAPADLFAAVMSDPAAALLAHGLAALDDETLRFLAAHPAMLTRLDARDAAVFAAFAAHFQIRNNRVVPAGGERAVPLWEALLHERVAHPEAFARELFARDEGRIAYLYDIIGHLDSSRAAFALGLWIDDAKVRVDRFTALASVAASSFGEWDATKLPFTRPPYDLLSLFSRIQVAPDGAPGFPARRWIWTHAFAGGDSWKAASQGPRNGDEDRLIDAAWLAEQIMPETSRWRMERLDELAFGQRVFAAADAAAVPDLLVAVRTLPRFRMLMLTLERIGVTRPALYAALARQADRVSALDADRARPALASLQGAIALVARMTQVTTIDRETAETLLGTLATLPFDRERGYLGAFVPWLQLHLRSALTADSRIGVERMLVEALAGAPGRIRATPVSWEGQRYLLDVVSSEALRLGPVRERQGGASIDIALDLHRLAEIFATGRATPKDIDEANAELTKLDPSAGAAASRAIEKLAAARNATGLPEGAQIAERLLEVVDIVIGNALVSFSYAVDWGDPQGGARHARNVALRHDFGLDKITREARVRTAWALPAQVFDAGVPWRVQGAILGLDVALAPLALRRISADAVTAPAISTTERQTFIVSLGLMNPFALQDATQDAIAEAIERGQRRVDGLANGASDVAAMVREIAMDGWRARAPVDHRSRSAADRLTVLDDRSALSRWRPRSRSGFLGHVRDRRARVSVHPHASSRFLHGAGRPSTVWSAGDGGGGPESAGGRRPARAQSAGGARQAGARRRGAGLCRSGHTLRFRRLADTRSHRATRLARAHRGLRGCRDFRRAADAGCLHGTTSMAMIMRSHAVLSFLLAVGSVATLWSASPQVRILSPGEGALITGLTVLRAAVDPARLASSVLFSVDGREVCTITTPPFQCEWDAGPSIASHQVRLVVNLVSGGRVVQTARTAGVAFAEMVDVDVVQVTATITDDRGRYVTGLPRSAFHVSEDGRSQVVAHFYAADAPLELVVAVDTSASMHDAMPTMKRAVTGFLAAVPRRDRVTLLGFNDAVFALAPRTADLAERTRAVDAMTAWGSTALYESILRGVEILGAQPGRKALIVFTDGEDRGSHVTLEEIEQALQSSDVILYMIGQGQGVTRAPLKKLMERLSRPTGGREISTNSIDELQESFIELLDEISHQYVLGYQPTNSARDGTWRQIKVTVDGGHRVRARHGYSATRVARD